MPLTLDEIFDMAQEAHLGGRLAEAIALYRQVLELRPDDAECTYFLGMSLFQLGHAGQAAELMRRAIELDGEVAEYHCDLGAALFVLKDVPGAIRAAARAVELRGGFPEAWFVLGNGLCKAGRFDEGIEAYQRVIALRPVASDAVNNLGMAYLQLGKIAEGIACFQRVLAAKPKDSAAHSSCIFPMYFSAAFSAADIRRELERWNAQHAEPLRGEILPHVNSRSGDRALRVGFVSADFRDHVAGWNMLSWLGEHDAKRMRVYCYSNVNAPDDVTRRIQAAAEEWREIGNLADAEAAKMIREDAIDILVDLSLHTSGNRLLLFARKPAPVQVSYLAYPGSSGMAATDYRLSDPVLGADEGEVEHCERTVCLPRTYWCYRPGGATPEVGEGQVVSSGVITFGCLNQFQKVSAAALEAWGEIMRAAAGSRLLLHAPVGRVRADVARGLERYGVEASRIEFVERAAWPKYIAAYQRIDIALDTFPYAGGITTCDALWMGVPVITPRGKTSVGRSGASILTNLNLTEFIAESADEYVAAAVKLAHDLPRLAELRRSLRGRMLESPLMDARGFARDIEAAFAGIWSGWVNSATA